MKDCPKCGAAVDGAWCAVCGEGKPPEPKPGAGPLERRKTITIHGREVSVKLCQHEDRGQLCAEIARFSQVPSGAGPFRGPFYCEKHFPPFRGRSGEPVPPPQGFKALKELLHAREPGQEG